METRTVRTEDGRELSVEVAGAPSERPVLVHCGTPNSRHLFDPWIEDAASRGMQLISYDRPGYGNSTPRSGYTVADAAGDVQTIASDLGIERLAVWGFSGGGPYTLATAALLPDLVVAAAIVGSVAPWQAPGLDYFTGMGESNFDDVKLYFSDPEASRKKARTDWEETIAVTADELTESFKTLLSEVDAAVLTGEFAEYLERCIHDGLAPGEQGWWDDGVAHMAPWGFDLESIRVPIKVWHGREDRFVPFQHGQWLAEHIPGAESYLSDTEGHLSLLVEKFPDVHGWLLGHF
ncbi:MAG TPA: alpha/beta fold hydrolase [Solirubrobacteraceae bacterium]|nr:alpha/beta fold hydrolase [Solirubrobacteraceae bacterium]